MVEKTSEKFLGKTTKFLGLKRKKKMFFFSRSSPTRDILDNSEKRWKKFQAFLGQKSCENHINSDWFQFILRCEESEKYLQLQKMKKIENLLGGKDKKIFKDLQWKKYQSRKKKMISD